MLNWLLNDKSKQCYFNNILDAGCGYGRNLLPFIFTESQLYGFDTCEEAVTYTQHRLRDSNSYIIKSNILECPWINLKFDLIICDGVLHQLLNKEQFQKSFIYLYKVLAPDGLFFFSIFTSDVVPDNSTQIQSSLWCNQYGVYMFLQKGHKILSNLERFYNVIVSKIDIFRLDVGKRSNLSCLLKKRL